MAISVLCTVPDALKQRMIVTTLFVGPNIDEQHLSKKASVICQVEEPFYSEKRLYKGTLEWYKHEHYVHKSNSL